MLPSAEQLSGISLESGWKVLEQIAKSESATGGNFSVAYVVESAAGKRAFLKALDFSSAMNAPDPTRTLEALTASFNFERDVLARCRDDRLGHVVTAISDGTIRIQNAIDGGVVPYLIFELADGDVRRQADINQRFDVAWRLRSLHHIAVGLEEIHYRGIAHQDIKPSNILVFDQSISKIADFGRAAYKGHIPPHENAAIPGDFTYAPIELLYGFVESDWTSRRFSCDMYLLGSMVTFFFTGTAMTPLMLHQIPNALSWRTWRGGFAAALPYLKDAFEQTLLHLEGQLPVALRGDLIEVVSQLCEPDPRRRGHPKNLKTLDRYSLVRFISKFNLLARRAELGLLKL